MPELQFYPPKPTHVATTINNGNSSTAAINIFGTTMVAIDLPASMDGTTLYIQGSIDDGTSFKRINDDAGNDYGITYNTTSSSRLYYINPAFFVGFDQIILEADSNQTAARSINIKVAAI